MAEFFTSSLFINFILPLGTVLLGIFVKTASRNDRFVGFKKEDLAVGFEIALASIIAFATYSVSISTQILRSPSSASRANLEEKIVSMPWLILAWLIGLWGISTLVRKLGWKSADELEWVFGIIIPFIYGIISMIFVFNWIGS